MNVITRKRFGHLLKDISPVLFFLLFSLLSSDFFNPSVKGWEVIYRVLFRFFRFTLFLCLPIYALSSIYGLLVTKLRRRLIQTERIQELDIKPLKHWIFRPFQGIGIGLLFETKLLTTLQVITGITAKPFLLSQQSHFQPGRLLIISGIAVIISLLLSTLWTLDDLGVRYVNRKDQEIKMIGRYIGTIMPIFFGFYGIFSLFTDFPASQVFIYLAKTVIILYPPFTIFAILHTQYLKGRVEYFSQRASLQKGGIW